MELFSLQGGAQVLCQKMLGIVDPFVNPTLMSPLFPHFHTFIPHPKNHLLVKVAGIGCPPAVVCHIEFGGGGGGGTAVTSRIWAAR